MTKPGWGAVVQGDPVDLSEWADALKEPFRPWIEVHQGETVLRSPSLDKLTSASEVRGRAPDLIARLNGAVALWQAAGQPLRFSGNVLRFAQDGSIHRTMVAGSAHIALRGVRVRVNAVVTGPDGTPLPPPPPRPSEVQRWAEIAERDVWLNDALMYFGKGADWFDVYKALECLILRTPSKNQNKKEAAFLALRWAPKAQVRLLKRTANWERHARRRFHRPKSPMSLNDATALLGKLLRRAFEETKI